MALENRSANEQDDFHQRVKEASATKGSSVPGGFGEMKKILFCFLIVVAFTVGCNAQPNTTTTFEVGIVNPAANKTYLVFMEFRTDSLSSRLVNNMDYQDPDVTDLDVTSTITNWHTVADTLFGEIEFADQTDTLLVIAGLVQVNDFTLKYSGMLTSYWSWLDVIEAMNASFFIRRKQ